MSAIAYDNDAASSASQPVDITVSDLPNQAPAITITSPSDGSGFISGSEVTITAQAQDSDGQIERVEFFVDGESIAVVNNAPFTVTWPASVAGFHNITAAAYDDDGAITTSAAVVVTVVEPLNTPPTITITHPASGTLVIAGARLTVTALADDEDGTIDRVEFFVDDKLLGYDLTMPYEFLWRIAWLGNYTLTAVAYDDKNMSTISQAVTVRVVGQTIFDTSFE